MITRATARKHLRRLAILAGGDDPERRDACLDAVQEYVRDEAELSRVVKWLWENEKFFPLPAKVAQALSVVRNAELPLFRSLKREFDCPACEDTGWKQVKGGLYPVSARCDHSGAVTASVAGDEDLEL